MQDIKIIKETIIEIQNAYDDIIGSKSELSEKFENLIDKLSKRTESDDTYYRQKEELCDCIDQLAQDEQRMNEESPNAPKPDGYSKSTRLFELKALVENVY